MSNFSVDNRGNGEVAIAGAIDFDNAEAVYRQTLSLLKAGEAVTIDLSAVTETDSASLAVVLEWIALAREGGTDLTLRGVPERVMAIAETSEVSGLIERYSSTSKSSNSSSSNPSKS